VSRVSAPAALSGACSPCIGVCRLTDNGLCEGCLRTVDEISAWASMDDAARQAVVSTLSTRRVEEAS